MRKPIAVLIVALVLAATRASGQDTPAFTPFGIIPVLDAYLESLRQQAGIPGMSAALVRDGVVIWEKGYGFQDVNARIRATPDTPYLIGDVSGTLSAVLLLQCVEQRRLELDVPLRQYGLAHPEPDVTLRQLLSHTFADASAEPFVYSPERYAQLTAVMEWCARGQPYRKSVAHRILNHLAMFDSVPGLDLRDPQLPLAEGLYDPSHLERYRAVLSRLAVPYKVDGRGRTQVTELPPMTITAADGLVSTVRDLAKLDGALDLRQLSLSDDTMNAAWNPVVGRRGTPVPMGLGWFVQYHRGQRVVWHFGQIPNAYSSLLIKVPERNITLILLANSDRLSAPFQLGRGDVTRSLFAALFLRLVT
jgi:CubicO group peptidase (beta-lactamase class C family)